MRFVIEKPKIVEPVLKVSLREVTSKVVSIEIETDRGTRCLGVLKDGHLTLHRNLQSIPGIYYDEEGYMHVKRNGRFLV